MIPVPPLFTGAVKVTDTEPFPRRTEPIVGAPGTVVGAALTRTESTRGVTEPSFVVRVARYCRYRPLGLLIAVPTTADHADQFVESFEVRVSNWMPVPAGVVVAAWRLIHTTLVPASWVCDTNVHDPANGDICIQSMETPAPSVSGSLANGRIGVVTASA
jgi:hypothetical protein